MKFYKISCAIMGVASFITMIITLMYATSGENLFKTPLAGILIAVFGILTVVCLCISTVKGRLLYKIGFYVLHIGIVVAVIGFIVYGLMGKKYNVTVFCDGKYYSAINDLSESSKGEMVNLGFHFRLDDTLTEYYYDENGQPTKNPKTYIAYVTFIIDDKTETVELKVNHPLHVGGYKVYLMGMVSDRGIEGANLIFKKDPAEYTVLSGLVMIIVGTFLMCLLGDIPIGKRASNEGKSADIESINKKTNKKKAGGR